MGNGEAPESARRVLDERLARGDISAAEHARALAALAEGRSPRTRRRAGRWLAVAGVVAVLATAGGVTAAAFSGGGPRQQPGHAAAHTSCQVPALPGSVVRVALTDHQRWMPGGWQQAGPMMGSPMMGGQPGGNGHRHGMMRVLLSRAEVPAGAVSFEVRNTGTLTHELVVLPLPAGQPAGARAIRPDGTVSEAGSLGEASATCGPGHGNGIAPGSAGWVTLRMPPGRYELVCNLPGHYAHDMYAELDVR